MLSKQRVHYSIRKGIVQKIQASISRFKGRPRFIFLGEKEYKQLKEEAGLLIHTHKKDGTVVERLFMCDILRVNRESFFRLAK